MYLLKVTVSGRCDRSLSVRRGNYRTTFLQPVTPQARNPGGKEFVAARCGKQGAMETAVLDWEQPGSEEENDLSYSLNSLEGVI